MMLAPLPNQIQTINDTVMGGQSTSQVRICELGIHFSGEVSLANNGGFASMRIQWHPVNTDEMQNNHFIQMIVKGDGLRYQFRLYTKDTDDGSAYVYHFDTVDGQLITINAPLSEFKASYRGRQIKKPALELNAVLEYGFLIGDKQVGEFSLLLKEISLPEH